MSTDLVYARLLQRLQKVCLTYTAERLDAILSEAARKEPTYLEFLDSVLGEELQSREIKRLTMHIKIAHFPAVKTLDDFEFRFQPSVDQKLIRELATSRYLAHGENVLVFGPTGVGKTHLAIALGRAAVETGHTVLFTTATALLTSLAHAESEGQLADKLLYYSKPKLLVVDELGYLPFEKRSAHLFFQLVARRYERGSVLLTTNQMVPQWGTVFGDDVLAAAILDRLLHHSHTILIQGESYRLRMKKKAGFFAPRGSEPSAAARRVKGDDG
jgi:DNA replication protein DnaC